MKLHNLIAISLATLTLYSCSGTPTFKSEVKLPKQSAWQKDDDLDKENFLFPQKIINLKTYKTI